MHTSEGRLRSELEANLQRNLMTPMHNPYMRRPNIPHNPPTQLGYNLNVRSEYESKDMRIKPDVDDLSTLEVLDEANVLNTLKSRYQKGIYYTYIGDILVAINPCQPVNLYQDQDHERYKNLYERRRQKPHIYWVADELYRNLRDSGDDQCAIVSGESGAGKTESITHILNHLIRLGPNNEAGDLVQQLEQVNPLLELFGNATTPLNKNSSRFCKFIELQYVGEGQLQNGQIQSFILEKSRLIQRHHNERNFHIFYALLGGLDPNIKSQISLGDAADYRILVGEDESAAVFNNQDDYREFVNKFEALEIALQRIGFNYEEIDNIYYVLSAILNLTNITFEYDHETETLDFEDVSQVQCVAELLNIDDLKALKSSLLSIKLNLEDIEKPKTLAEANEGRDALAKELYYRLFSCIIDKINAKLRESVPLSPNIQTKKLPTINLLDISGFENLTVNGFEQLLINTANEVLHQIFLKYVMKREKEECEKEGVEWTDIKFLDNANVIDLITKSKKETATSIFHILEEEASISPSNDISLVRKLNINFDQNPHYRTKNESDIQFGIIHYADTVMYSAVGFIEKTKDTLSRCLKNVIQQSKNPLLIRYYTIGTSNNIGGKQDLPRTKDVGMKRNESVTKQFRTSLRQLQTKLCQSNLMFVRCLKPNVHLKPNKFDQRCMNVQLRACGLAEAASIRRDGYPVRMCFAAFANRYENIIGTNYHITDDKEKCLKIIKLSRIDKYHIGKTKILLNYQEKDSLESMKIQYKDFTNAAPSGRSSFSSNGPFQDGIRTPKNNKNKGKCNLNFETSPQTFEKDDDISENNDSPFQQMDQANVPAYDAFRETERDVDEGSDFFTKILKLFRFLFYIFTISGILISAVSNRIGLLLLAGSTQNKVEHAKLFISLAIPMLFSWLWNATKCAFRGKVNTSWKSYLFIGLLELFRTAANCAMVFLILPNIGIFRGLIMIYGFGQVPAFLLFLETFFTNRTQKTSTRFLQRAIYFLIFILQLCIIPAYLATNFLTWTDKKSGKIENYLSNFQWLIPIVILVISLSMWENYALFDIKIFNWHLPLKSWRKRMMKVRESTNFFIEPFKMGLFYGLSWKLSDYDLEKFWESYKDTIGEPEEHLRHFGLMYLQLVSAFICNYLAGMACKLHMQKFGFALPLIFVTPIAIVVSFLLCEKDWIPQGTFKETEFRCCTIDFGYELISPIVIMSVSWITILVITAHVWYPQSERMAQISKLFIPQCDPLLLDLSLLIRRRQDHKENKEKIDKEGKGDNNIPTLLVCATTWHETRQEMVQLLKSLFRLDLHQIAMKIATKYQWVKNDNDRYDLKIHIIFDDAWEIDEVSGQEVPNDFVKEFVSLIPEAVMSVAKGYVPLSPIKRVTTPYGGRLEVRMPGGTPMVIHLKNKEKIRHRKRWSQVMYLYYLLGYKTFGHKESVENLLSQKHVKSSNVRRHVSILNHLPEEDYKKTEKTFLLTLDGDVDFKPDSVKLLIDRMLMNKKVGAVCGRIHPIGSGPMIWYQQFEYAVGHWLQKAAEHVFGCVLCCPGCFSLFRASAVMDDNVMRAYTRKPIVARDYIQYEQGEDRWLCTLLLQQGYKIDYCAGADAYTFAPESFHDFYIQRRRWAPSTIANIMDLLSTWHTTVYLNDNISVFFMFYQFILMTSSILAPATVVLMIAGSYTAVLKISMWKSFAISLAPVILYIIVCLKTKTNTQIAVAAFMTSIYSVVMVIVTVGTIINILSDDFVAPNVVFLVGLSLVFSICGLLHPREMICLVHGILYFLTVPSSFIFLTIYFLCNLNIVSWGTREVAKKLTLEEREEAKIAEEEKLKKKKEKSFFNFIGLLPLIEEIKKIIYDVLGRQPPVDPNAQQVDVENQKAEPLKKKVITRIDKSLLKRKVDPYFWTTLPCFGEGHAEAIDKEEEQFWRYILKKYLHPLQDNKDEKEKIKEELEATRNNVVFGYFLLNLLWSVAIMQLQTMKSEMLPFFIAGKYEPISVMFLAIFGIVLLLQFFGMCMHRWGTFLHLMSTTHLLSNDANRKQAEQTVMKMTSASTNIDLEPDYSSSENDSDTGDMLGVDLPEADYDFDNDETNESTTYEKFFKDRMKTFKLNNTCRQRHRKTLKFKGHNNPIFQI